MKQIFLLITFFQVFSIGLNAQHDSLLNSDTPFVLVPNDSIYIHPLNSSHFFLPLTSIATLKGYKHFNLPTNSYSESYFNAEGAKFALKIKEPLILISWKPGKKLNFHSVRDTQFQKKYRVEFFSLCGLASGENEDEEAYNQVIFAYLDKKYGTVWRSELRADAIGFEAPEKIAPIQVEASLQIVRVPNPASNFKPVLGRNDENVQTQFLIIKITTVGLVALLILYFLLRKRKSKF